MHERPTQVQEYGEWIRQHTAAVKAWIKEADEEYRKTLEKAGSAATLRHLAVGDQVSRRVPDLERKKKNAGADTWDGPWEIVQVGEMETDYLIKRAGSRQQPTWAHIDNLKQQFEDKEHIVTEIVEEAVMQPAKNSAKSYNVEEIVGEAGRSRSSKHYLIKFEGYEDSWWQPAKNLYCPDKVKQWDQLSAEAKALKSAQATVANPDDICLIMDL